MSTENLKTFEDLFYNCEMPVIPLVGKRPIIKDWSRFCSKMPTDIDYASFAKAGNIGLCLGPASGVIALDIDTDDKKVLTACPKSPLVKRGKKGETRFFKYNNEIATKRHDLGIEILSLGNQTVLPPSIHPDTKKKYIWTKRDVWFDDVDSLPSLDMSFLGRIEGKKSNIMVSNISGRNDKLKAYCAGKIADGKDPTTVIEELIKEDINLHGGNALFSDKKEFKTNDVQLNALTFYSNIVKSVKEVHWDISQEIETIETVERPKINYKESKLPHWQGIGADMFDYVYRSSPIRRSNLAFASVLATMSTIIGNKIHYNGIYPNIYAMILAPSGFGKDAPLKFPYKLFSKAGVRDLIGEGHPASDTGIMMNLPTQRVRLDAIDEASVLFASIKSKQSSFLSKMADVYATLYTSSGDYFVGKNTMTARTGQNQSGNIGACDSPYVSMLCAMTIKDFNTHVDTNTLEKGLGGRFLYFADREIKAIYDIKYEEIPDKILKVVAAARKNNTPNDYSGTEHVDAVNIKATREAETSLHKLRTSYSEQFIKLYEKDSKLQPIYMRAYVTLVKVAIIAAWSKQSNKRFNNIELDQTAVDFASSFMTAYLNNMDSFLDTNLNSNSLNGFYNDVYKFIDDAGIKMRSKSELSKYAQKTGKKKAEMTECLSMLIDSEYIIQNKKNMNNSKKPTTFFVSMKSAKIVD